MLPASSTRSGHKAGKSSGAGAIAWWWYATRDEARVICTSPVARQVREVLWREVKQLHKRSRRLIEVDGKVADQPSTGVNSVDGRQIIGFTADDDTAFSGISGPNVLYLVDEANGIKQAIADAIEGNRAGGAHVMYFGNPTTTSGMFFDSHHSQRGLYKALHISSEDAARYTVGIPGMATQKWVDERKKAWGVDSAIYQIRVLGNFPPEGANTVISLVLVDEAKARWASLVPDGELVIGVDVAREGDDATVLQPVRGRKALAKRIYRSRDGVQVAGFVAAMARDLRGPLEHGRIRVNVDTIGVGSSVVDQLNYNHAAQIAVCAVNVARSADDEDKFHNLRAQIHFGLRDWLAEGGSFAEDPELEGELVAATFKFDARGRYQVEKKEEIKKRLGRSPDKSDALQLATFRGRFVTDTKVIRAAGRFTRAR